MQFYQLCEKAFMWKRTTTYTMLKRLCERKIFENSHGTVRELMKREELVCSYAFESFDTQLLKNNKVFVFSLADGKQIIWGFEDTAGNDVKAYSCIIGEKNLMEVSKELMATYQKIVFRAIILMKMMNVTISRLGPLLCYQVPRMK